MIMFMVNPAADSKISPMPTHVAVPLETESNELSGNRFINAASLIHAPHCGVCVKVDDTKGLLMRIYEKWDNLNNFCRHIKKPGKNLSLK
jgi:hypothetical protein